MYIAGSIDDYTKQDQQVGAALGAQPIDVMYDVDFILDNCPTKDKVQDFLQETHFKNKEALIVFFKKEFGYEQPEL